MRFLGRTEGMNKEAIECAVQDLMGERAGKDAAAERKVVEDAVKAADKAKEEIKLLTTLGLLYVKRKWKKRDYPMTHGAEKGKPFTLKGFWCRILKRTDMLYLAVEGWHGIYVELLDQLVAACEAQLPEREASELSSDAKYEEFELKVAPLKDPVRIHEKAEDDYRGDFDDWSDKKVMPVAAYQRDVEQLLSSQTQQRLKSEEKAQRFPLGRRGTALTPALPPRVLPKRPPSKIPKEARHAAAGCANYLKWRQYVFESGMVDGRSSNGTIFQLFQGMLFCLDSDSREEEYLFYSNIEHAALGGLAEMLLSRWGMRAAGFLTLRGIGPLESAALEHCGMSMSDLERLAGAPGAEEEEAVSAGGGEFKEYAALRDKMHSGPPSAKGPTLPLEQYAELDVRLLLLSKADMEAEYRRYAEKYVLGDGFSEMRLMRLGEALDMSFRTRLRRVCGEKMLAEALKKLSHIVPEGYMADLSA
jgi:hypothetical protein